MEQKQMYIAGGVFVLIVAGLFAFMYFQKSAVEEAALNEEPAQQEEEDGPYDYIDRIDAKHFFINGVHTLVGEILMPTPCDLLEWDVAIAESFPEQVTVNFSVLNNAETCVQVVTPQRFKVEFSVSENATIQATFMGRRIDLNLIPAAEGETHDDFELFIKG